MKLRNSTPYSDRFIRRMIAWCAKELDLPVRKIKAAQFTRPGKYGSRGAAWPSMRILVRVEREDRQLGSFERAGVTIPAMDGMGRTLWITAHEVAHLVQFSRRLMDRHKRKRDCEGFAERRTLVVYQRFAEQRDALLAHWNEPEAERSKTSVVDKRAAKAQADLARWLRKLKLAQTKVRKYKRTVAYYEKRSAACGPTINSRKPSGKR
jgi:hypothetical protein